MQGDMESGMAEDMKRGVAWDMEIGTAVVEMVVSEIQVGEVMETTKQS